MMARQAPKRHMNWKVLRCISSHEKIKTGKITAVQHDLIHLLSEMISTQDHYETICDSLGVPPEYGPMAKP